MVRKIVIEFSDEEWQKVVDGVRKVHEFLRGDERANDEGVENFLLCGWNNELGNYINYPREMKAYNDMRPLTLRLSPEYWVLVQEAVRKVHGAMSEDSIEKFLVCSWNKQLDYYVTALFGGCLDTDIKECPLVHTLKQHVDEKVERRQERELSNELG